MEIVSQRLLACVHRPLTVISSGYTRYLYWSESWPNRSTWKPCWRWSAPVEILLNSAGLSYHDAIDDENRLELPVHNVRQLPSLLEYMDAYKIALQDIRREIIPPSA